MAVFGRCLTFCVLALLAGCSSTPPAPAPVIESRAPTLIESPAQPPQAVAALQAAPRPDVFYTVKKGDTLISIALDQGHSYRDIAAWNSLDNPNRIQVGQQLRMEPPVSAVAVAQAITAPAPLEARPLEAGPLGATVGNTEMLKREPKGGKLPYSPQALAQLEKSEALPQTLPAPGQTSEQKAKPAAEMPVAAPVAPVAPGAGGDDEGVDWAWPLEGKLIGKFAEGSNKGIDIASKMGSPVLAAAAGKVVYAGSNLRGYGKLVIIKHNTTFLSAYAHNSVILVKEGQSVVKGQKIAESGASDSDQPMLHFEIRRQGKPVDPFKHLPSRAP